jgi:hypothetical protein
MGVGGEHPPRADAAQQRPSPGFPGLCQQPCYPTELPAEHHGASSDRPTDRQTARSAALMHHHHSTARSPAPRRQCDAWSTHPLTSGCPFLLLHLAARLGSRLCWLPRPTHHEHAEAEDRKCPAYQRRRCAGASVQHCVRARLGSPAIAADAGCCDTQPNGTPVANENGGLG